ncbi:MAG: hypothetical protein MI974_33380 [Chitinophagales bacterium]|nr:hypothetical protein [Chitinophagales bacterium]
MEILKKIIYVLSTTFWGGVLTTAIGSSLSTHNNGWDGIAAALGYLMLGGIIFLLASIFSLRYFVGKKLNLALIISLCVSGILLVLAAFIP